MSNEIEKYDDMVRKYGLSHNIATNKSKGIWANQIPSDHLFQTYEQFVCKRLANQTFGIKWPELEDWGPKECRKFYNERLMEGTVLPTQYHLNQSDNAIATTLAGTTPETREVLAYRWNNGYAFMDVSERVDLALKRVNEAKSIQVKAALKKMQQAEKAREEVRGILNDGAKQVSSPRAAAVLMNMAASLGLSDYLESDEEDN